MDGYSTGILYMTPPRVNFVMSFWPDGKVNCQARYLNKNVSKMTRPFRSTHFAAGFNFSYGHLILNAGYLEPIANVFNWEEPY